MEPALPNITSPPPAPPLRIGPLVIDPPLLQAPMAGFTNYAYRQIVRGLGGVGLPATEMISARGFMHLDARSHELPDRLWGVKDEPRPLAVQIWDNDPETLAAVGQRLAREFAVSVVDINFGCPAGDVAQKAKSGSYLLRDPDQIGRIVQRVVDACRPTTVTAKIRLGCSRDRLTAIEVAQAVESAGGAALTVHGRTGEEFFRGTADWESIARIKPHLKSIPLIGNGDLRTAQAVVEAFSRYGVDGVMIGRAGLGQPWLFAQAAAALCGRPTRPEPTLAEQKRMILDHFRLVLERFGAQRGTILMRRFACCYAQGRAGARAFRGAIATAATPGDFLAIVKRHFPVDPGESGSSQGRTSRPCHPDQAAGPNGLPS
jgi:tRNA-dihydrouridine synthase B